MMAVSHGAARAVVAGDFFVSAFARNSLSAAVPFGALAKCAGSAVEIFFRRM